MTIVNVGDRVIRTHRTNGFGKRVALAKPQTGIVTDTWVTRRGDPMANVRWSGREGTMMHGHGELRLAMRVLV
jgi:hypothetical protein